MPYAYCEQIGKEIRDISDEIPFDIPESWHWVRVKDLAVLFNGKAFKPSDWTDTGLPIVRIQNLNNNNAIFNYYNGKVEECFLLNGGELLFAWSGTPGTSFGAHIWTGKKAVLNQHIFRLDFNKDLINQKYFMYVLNQRVTLLITLAHGSAGLQHVTKGTFENTLIPLPPLNEQLRIVSKIEELLPYIEAYEKAETQLTALNTSFPDMLKKSILQEAVQGKLVSQNPDDEPASVLLERIRAEKQELIKQGKIKKDKHESVIITRDKIPYEIQDGKERCIADEVPFEIPESWCWCRLPQIAQSGLGKTLNKSTDTGEPTPYLCSINVYWNGIDLSKLKTANFSIDDKKKYLLKKGDLLICEGGDVGRSAVWDNDTEMYYQNALHRVRFYSEINPYFYLKVLELYKSMKILDECSKGVTIKHLVQGSLNSLYFPLPPLSEQKRIVDKIEELMTFCEKLK